MEDRKPENGNKNPQDSVWENLTEAFTTLMRGLGKLLTDPNQPRLAVRSRQGVYLFRLPIAIAALIGLFLLWKAFLLLALLVVAVLATRSSFVLIRPTVQN